MVSPDNESDVGQFGVYGVIGVRKQNNFLVFSENLPHFSRNMRVGAGIFPQAAITSTTASTEGQVQTRFRSPKALSILATAGQILHCR